MHPQPILGLDAFYLVLLIMVPPAVFYLGREIHKAGYSLTRFIALQIGIAVICVLGAKLFSLYLRDWQWAGADYELLGGWKYPGAIIGLLAFTPFLIWWILPQYPVARFCDTLVIIVAFCLAVFRINCFMKGCCTGPICDGELCIPYASGSVVWYEHFKHGHLSHPTDRSLAVMPLHLYFLVSSLAVAVFLKWYESRKTYDGQILLLFLFLHEGMKAVLESWRVPHSWEVQLVSLALCLGALVLLIWNWQQARAPLAQ